jgi:hypothetical protein
LSDIVTNNQGAHATGPLAITSDRTSRIDPTMIDGSVIDRGGGRDR